MKIIMIPPGFLDNPGWNEISECSHLGEHRNGSQGFSVFKALSNLKLSWARKLRKPSSSGPLTHNGPQIQNICAPLPPFIQSSFDCLSYIQLQGSSPDVTLSQWLGNMSMILVPTAMLREWRGKALLSLWLLCFYKVDLWEPCGANPMFRFSFSF